MKRTWTLRRQLNVMLALIVIFQSLALVLALWVSQVYYLLDAEAVRLLNNTTENRAQTFDSTVGQLIGSMVAENENMDEKLVSLAIDRKSVV